MRMRLGAVWLTVLVVVATLAAAGVGAAFPGSADAAPPDPAEDVLGWEDGVWHNESIDVDQSDGLTEAELETVLARTMARVEYVRGIEFERAPEVTFLTREEYGEVTDELFGASGASTADRLHQNTKFEALGLVGEDTDYFAVRRQNQASFAAAFYVTTDVPGTDLSEGDLGIVVDGDAPRVREPNLGHELVHALQNQRFDSSELDYGNTEDSARAANGVVEGDASYVDTVYDRRCGDQWDCLEPPEEPEPPEFANLGLVVYDLFVYGEGPDFVEHVVDERGWAGVDALYDRLPATTEQIIYPPRHPGDTPRNVTVADRSTETWEIPDVGEIDYATFGEAGLFVLLWYPGHEGGQRVVMSPNAVFTGNDTNPYNFSHSASEGWEGDKLYPYVNDSSGATNETGYVWKTAWESAADAREFAAAYRDVLAFRGGERVGRHTWRLPEGSGFGDAVHLVVEGETVTVVNAPTVGALSEIRQGIVVEPLPTGTTTATPTPTSTALPGVPGLGAGAAAVAVAAALVTLGLRGRGR